MSKDFRCNICDLYFRFSGTLNDHHKQEHHLKLPDYVSIGEQCMLKRTLDVTRVTLKL